MQSVDCNKLEVVNGHHARRDLLPDGGAQGWVPFSSHESVLSTNNWMQ